MSVPGTKMIPVSRPAFGRGGGSRVVEVLRSGWVTQGPQVAEFERKFAEYVGAEHAVAVSSCTTALHLALWRPGFRRAMRCSARVCRSSLRPTRSRIAERFRSLSISTRRHITLTQTALRMPSQPRTKAILVVHQIGLPAALDEINEIANRHGLLVIEDAACAIGSEYKGHRIGRPHSLMACFSFHPRKILTTGEGGMITTADAELAARLRRLRQHAMTVSDVARHSSQKVVIESYDEVGYNYRMTDMQAAVGLVQLQRLNDMLNRRRMLAERYSAAAVGVWMATAAPRGKWLQA